MKIGIIQPGRLGDIIICLPIAKYYTQQGHKVIWPMFESIGNMVKDVVNYVDIRSTTDNVYTCVSEARAILKSECVDKIIDIAATFPGSECTDEYVRCGDGKGPETFDAFKYRLANVSINEKWNLSLTRSREKENELYNKYVTCKNYVVTSLTHSKGQVEINLDVGDNIIVPMNSNHNVFHWIRILEEAKGIVCVESSISNLVEQLNLTNKKILIRKDASRLPMLKNNWKII
jgi:hypothetical protein